MLRPCFLVVDRETSTGISTRKLIIETAKFNVITAYSSEEAIETLRQFPNVDGVVTDSGMTDMVCDDLLSVLKQIKPSLHCVVVKTLTGTSCNLADCTLDTFDPRKLLEVLENLVPEAAREIERRNEELEQLHFKHLKKP
jgi:DNA-binding NtrC family response regulator